VLFVLQPWKVQRGGRDSSDLFEGNACLGGGIRNPVVGSCSRQFSGKDEVLMLSTVNCYQGRISLRSQTREIYLYDPLKCK
jgi:hypothetical protein